MKFSQIIGQEHIVQDLVEQVNSDKIPHAQLFLEREGSGGLKLALAFAQYILCENKANGVSCECCPSCVKASKMEHPDIHFSFPSIAIKSGKPAISDDHIVSFRKALIENVYLSDKEWIKSISSDNKSGNITADECRRIIQKLNLKAYESRYKIMIIWKPEQLGKEGNILLKLLEEPPENTIIIMVGEQSEQILPTILSRMQIVKLQPLAVHQIQKYLESHFQFPESEAQAISILSRGNLNIAIQTAQKNQPQYIHQFKDWLNMMIKEQNSALLKWCDNMHKEGREPIKNYLDYVLNFLEGFLINNVGDSSAERLNVLEQEVAFKLAEFLSINKVQAWSHLIERKISDIERNGYAKLVLLDLSIQSTTLLKGQ